MTSISGSSTLTALISLYEKENAAAGSSTGSKLTKDQLGGIEDAIEGKSSTGTTTDTSLSSLLGNATTSSTDLNSIIDSLEAKSGTTDSGSTTTTTTSTATTPQQKAMAVLQSVFQSQQSNLFTLIG